MVTPTVRIGAVPPPKPTLPKGAWFFAALVGILIGTMCFVTRGELFGVQGDFYAYWAAVQLFWRGQNPFDAGVIARFDANIVSPPLGPRIAWNPPFLLVFLSPIAALSYVSALSIWTGLSLFWGLCTGLMVWGIDSRRAFSVRVWVLATVFCVPLFSCLKLGQISTLLSCSLALGIWFLSVRRDWLAGLAFVPLCAKPHVFYLVGVTLLVWFIREGRYRAIVGAGTGLMGASLLAEVVHPGIHHQWAYRDSWPTNYAGSTLTALVRQFLISSSGVDPIFVVCAVMMVGGTVAFFALIQRFPQARNLPDMVSLSLVISLLTAPYGFVFDQAALVLAQNRLVARVYNVKYVRRLIVGYMFTSLAVIVLSRSDGESPNLPLYWFVSPLLLLLAWLVVLTVERRDV